MKTQTANTTKNRPVFGQRVRIKAKAVRRLQYGADELPELKANEHNLPYFNGESHRSWRVWARRELREPADGIYIGYRTLQDGETRWEGEEIGNVFKRCRDLSAWLIVLDEHRKPVLAFPEDVEIVTG